MAGARAAPRKLLVFGDSLVAGYGLAAADGFQAQLSRALRADGLEVVILDGGVSGDTSADGLARLDWALADAPDAVFLELGANDALRALDPAQTQANLAQILAKLKESRIPVLLTGMEAPPNLGDAYGAQFRAVYTTLAPQATLFDPFFLQNVAGNPALNQADGMHPNPTGVSLEVARLKPLVERLLQH
jgi:acyl-CoA thioesterase-1